MADKTRTRLAAITGKRLVDEPADQSQWDAAQRANDAWDELRDRRGRGELTSAEYNRRWRTLLHSTDPTVRGLAARLNQVLRDALREEPSA